MNNCQEKIEGFIVNKKAKNAKGKTKSDINILDKYLNSIGRDTVTESLPNAGDRLSVEQLRFTEREESQTAPDPTTSQALSVATRDAKNMASKRRILL